MSFEQLWAAWRHQYVTQASATESGGELLAAEGCVFCKLAESGEPSEGNGVVWRGTRTFAVLNAYPYASGHLLVLPLRHETSLSALSAVESQALWEATLAAVRAIERAYRPDGMNLGANLGRAAGAGIPGHVHLHVLPRWSGDTNFMTSVAGIRVMPESLQDAWHKLHAAWEDLPGSA